MHKTLHGLLLLLAFAGFATAQETGSEVTEEEMQAAEREEIEPSLSSAELAAAGQQAEANAPTVVLAQDIRRRTVGNAVMDEIELERAEITALPTVLGTLQPGRPQ